MRGTEAIGRAERKAECLPRSRQVRLERPSVRREAEFLLAVRRSRVLHARYVEPPSTAEEYRRYLGRQRQPSQESFLVVDLPSGSLAGVINVNNIVRDSLLSGTLGYYAFVPFAGLGLMREGLELVIAWCFRELRLHRLEANIQPSNTRSIGLAAGLGFRHEGMSARYLKIRGRWRDHERWALLAEDWRARDAASDRARLSGARAARSTPRAPQTRRT